MGLLGNGADCFFNLHGQFTSWCEDQRACGLALALVTKCDDFLQDRQAECSGFARAGLCDTQNVATFQLVRNSLCLDRLWLGHASSFNAFEQHAGNAKSGKAAGVFSSQFKLFRRHRKVAVRFKTSDKRNLPNGNILDVRRDAGILRSTCAAVPETSRVSPAIRPF